MPEAMIADDPFLQLQNQLRDRWRTAQEFDTSAADIVVIPSLSLDQRELQKVQGFHHYEERLLFSLIRLRNPRTRLVYLTSQPLHHSIIDYYLQFLPGIPFSHARDRLLLLSTYDGSLKTLTQKILDRPRLLERIRQAVNPDRAYMVCFNATVWERELSLKLGIPLLASDPALLKWGTKSGSRQIFQESGVNLPDGTDLVINSQDLAEAIAQLCSRNPGLKRVVVKLNEGFSGEGNALLDLRGLDANTNHDRQQQIYQHFPNLQFEAAGETWENYQARIAELGAIAEVFIEGQDKRSPSVQARITPLGEVEILSTHDQILGGQNQQVYLGCRFPAEATYRLQLQELGKRIGQNLAEKGALERFGVDFVVVREGQDWQIYAIEINLRKGGTTHPFMTLRLLTNGDYDLTSGQFFSQLRSPKYYMATDTLQRDHYRGILPNDLMDMIAYHQLHFDTSTDTGTVFHLMGCLSEFGKLGVTCIGNSPQHADAIYQNVIQVLDQETLHPTPKEIDRCFNWHHR
jgi:PGM1 C-terminal domain/ATP-grasp domain